MPIQPMLQLARPKEWVKNVVVFMPIVFGLQMRNSDAWLQAFLAAVAFCLASSFAYIINDIKDRQSDRCHPVKKERPLASGQISTKAAVIEAVVLVLLALGLAQSLSSILTLMIFTYLLLQVCYTMFLKNRILIDVICIALGFVVRTASGAVAIEVAVSGWLFICMFTICLFMGFCKRYSEVVTIGDKSAVGDHRPTLIAYTPELLTHLITLSAGIAVVAFLVYGLNEKTVSQFGTNYLIYTLPAVVYAVFRFAMLSMKGTYAGPTDIFIHDRPFQVTILIWWMLILVIIRFGSQLNLWLQGLY